jgi:hypothetical protein
MPAIFLIVGDIASDVIRSAIDTTCPMVDDGVVDDVTIGIDNIECKSVPQSFGKPIATSTAKTLDDFLSFTVIREPRYEVQYCLPEFLTLRC